MRSHYVAAALTLLLSANLAMAETGGCAGPDVVGVSRTINMDDLPVGVYGAANFALSTFLQDKEVVVSFDDGPTQYTPGILETLAKACVKATFFSIGRKALASPRLIQATEAEGHTVGTHTFSHVDLSKISFEEGREEIELGLSAVTRALGHPPSPLFRFPYLNTTPEALDYLAARKIVTISPDVDSFDYNEIGQPEIVADVLKGLAEEGRGVIMLHEIMPNTAAVLPDLLKQLKANGYRIVHLAASAKVETQDQADRMIGSIPPEPVAGATTN